jgi:hypothetical protein
LQELALKARKQRNHLFTSWCQITGYFRIYDDNKPTIDAIVISTQHDDFDEEATMLAKIKKISLKFDPKNYCKKPNKRSFI